MHSDRASIERLLSEPHGGSLPAGYPEAVETLLAGRSLLLVTPRPRLHTLAWELAAARGARPLLVIASSARGLADRADEIAARAGLVTCRISSEIAGTGLDTLRDQFGSGRWDAALVAARHLADPRVMETALALKPKLLVVEDAHCLSAHGHRFDPCVAHAVMLAQEADRVLALSDVADRSTRNEIADLLEIRTDPAMIGLDPPGLRLEVHNTPGQSRRDAHLLSLIKEGPERAIVYVEMRVEAERLAWLIEDQCGLPSAGTTNREGAEFGAALRRFREGSIRVLVATGCLTATDNRCNSDRRWPEVPLVIVHSLPDHLEMLHRQIRLATGSGARAVLLYDREQREALERRHLRCAPEAGHLIAIFRAIVGAGRVGYDALSTLTGLHPEQVHLGVQMLVDAGVLRVRKRGDDWLEADSGGELAGEILINLARNALVLRRTRMEKARRLPGYARARGCRREALGRALDYPVAGRCGCDHCVPAASQVTGEPPVGGFPIETNNAAGWAAGLYHQPGMEDDGQAGVLVQRLKYDGDETALRPLAQLMIAQTRERPHPAGYDFIVPIPPTDPDAASSTATVLAERLSVAIGVPVADVLESTGDRIAQKELSSFKEKRRNIAGGFKLADGSDVSARTVLLVDDIFDSGATMHEVARVLRSAGAREVRLLAAVRTIFGWRRDF